VFDLAQFMAFAWLMTAMALLIGWTTRLDDIAAALNRLLRPFGRLGLPVKEIGTVLVIAVRTVPLLIEEVRVIVAARKLRPNTEEQPYLDAGAGIAVALVVSTFRRAGEMARTLAARGGIRTPPPDRERPGRRDLAAAAFGLIVVALVIAVMGVLTGLALFLVNGSAESGNSAKRASGGSTAPEESRSRGRR
jgi:energy-coupling factor transport system permease protein